MRSDRFPRPPKRAFGPTAELPRLRELFTIRDGSVTLLHQTVKDFLLNPATDSGWVMESVRLDPASTHIKLAEPCLELLGQDTTSSEYAVLRWT